MGKGNYWPVKVKLYWCPESNTPLLREKCRSGLRAPPLKLTEPGDARPAFDYDLKIIEQAYLNEFGSIKGFHEFMGKGVVLLNKVPYMDLMREIVSQGAVIGRAYFEPFSGMWRLRLSRPGILRIMDLQVFNTLKIDSGLHLLKRRRKLRAEGEGFKEGEQIVIVDGEGEPIGIGYYSGGLVDVHNVFYTFYPEKFAGDVDSTLEDAVRENEDYLAEMEDKAVSFIRSMYEKHGGPVVVSFSSGKDSLVALHLTLKAGIEPKILFNNTGIELPETVEHVYRIADKWGLEVIESSAGNSFWKAVKEVGPPGKDYRWCCKVTKLAPLASTIGKLYPGGVLNIVGQRAYESLDRAKSGRVWRNKWLPQVLNISPIQYWSQVAIYLYIVKYKLPLNPLYLRGFDRLGCFMCPAANIAEYIEVKKTHPELWSRWENTLYRWAERLGLSGSEARLWVEKGVWRWLTPAAQKKRLAQRIQLDMPEWNVYYSRWLRPSAAIVEKDGVTDIVFDGSIDRRFLDEQYSVLGPFKPSTERKAYSIEGTGVSISVEDSTVRVKGIKGRAARELAYDILKIFYRWIHCGECRLCEASCPTGAIKVVDGKPRVDNGKCIHCKLCIDNCPISDVTVERIAVALNEGNVTAWRRPWKRSRESIIKRYLRLKYSSHIEESDDEDLEEKGFYLGG